MSIAEKLGEGIGVLVVGLVVVFAVLMILWGVLALFKVLFYDMPNKKKQKLEATPKIEEPVAFETNVYEVEDDTEIVAVITAAIAASLNTTSSNFKIKSLRRISNWKKENGGY